MTSFVGVSGWYPSHQQFREVINGGIVMEKTSSRKGKGNPFYPAPKARVPAGYGGPVETPSANDVLSGRGGAVNGHAGNKQYRAVVNGMKAEYLSPKTRKSEKTHIAARIVFDIRQLSPPGRFLKVDPSSGLYYEIGDRAAFRKTGQALRENSSEYRSCWRDMLAEGAGDDKKPKAKPTE